MRCRFNMLVCDRFIPVSRNLGESAQECKEKSTMRKQTLEGGHRNNHDLPGGSKRHVHVRGLCLSRTNPYESTWEDSSFFCIVVSLALSKLDGRWHFFPPVQTHQNSFD